MRTILVVDDDPHLRQVVEFALRRAGFEVALAADGLAGLAALARQPPDLLILDVLMPELDGLEVCRRVRATSRVPIIFLTSVDEEADRIVGLELGADDYLAKPFSPRELVARVRAVLRRSAAAPVRAGDGAEPPAPLTGAGLQGAAPPAGMRSTSPERPAPRTISHGALRLDLDRCTVAREAGPGACPAGQPVDLSARELAILRTLLAYPGKVYSRDELMERAYPDGTIVSERTIDSHMKRLRKKLTAAGLHAIDTVHGLGYRLAAPRSTSGARRGDAGAGRAARR